MNAMKIRVQRGDNVEVRFATHDGFIWHPAVVMHANEDTVEVQYASGHRRVLQNDAECFRAVRAVR